MNQYSRWALAQNLERGETVALMMRNRPEYFAIWLGLTQIGAIVALVSPDLRAPALAHALQVSQARRLIVGRRLRRTSPRSPVASLGAGRCRSSTHDDLAAAISTLPGEPLGPGERREVDARRPRAAHLHLGHDGPAEGGRGQPSPHHRLDATGSPASPI